MQKHVSQIVKTHKRRGIVDFKIPFSNATQADSETIRLSNNYLLTNHLKDFDRSVSKAVEEVRELVGTLEASDILSSSYAEDVIAVFREKTCCEDFRLHLKIFEMDKLKGNAIEIYADGTRSEMH